MNIDMSKATEDSTYCCNFCKCVEGNKHIFKNTVLRNRIRKCRIVDILTETQRIDMYGNKQIDAYNNHMEKHKYDIDFKNKRNQSQHNQS